MHPGQSDCFHESTLHSRIRVICPPPLLPHPQGDEETYAEWERIYGHGAVEGSALGLDGLGVQGNVGSRDYVFSANNPFLGDAQALAKGKDLFR